MSGDRSHQSERAADDFVQPVIPASSIDTQLVVGQSDVIVGEPSPDSTPFILTITSPESLAAQIDSESLPDDVLAFVETTDFDEATIVMVGHHTLDGVGLSVDRIVHQDEATLYVSLSETHSPDHEYPTVDRLTFLAYFIRVPTHYIETSPTAVGSLITLGETAVELSARDYAEDRPHQI